jgi:hypothetical protein
VKSTKQKKEGATKRKKKQRKEGKRSERKIKKNSQVLINFLCLSVFSKETSQNSHSANPDNLGRHSGLSRTVSFSCSSMAALSLGSQILSNSGSRVDGLRLFDDETILDELSNVLSCSQARGTEPGQRPKKRGGEWGKGIEKKNAERSQKSRKKIIGTRVGHRNLIHFVGVEPDLLSSAFHNAGSESFLEPQRNHGRSCCSPKESKKKKDQSTSKLSAAKHVIVGARKKMNPKQNFPVVDLGGKKKRKKQQTTNRNHNHNNTQNARVTPLRGDGAAISLPTRV